MPGMSQDITYDGGITVRDPEPGVRPAPANGASLVPKGDAAQGDCPVYVSAPCLQSALVHAGSDPARECGGWLVGGRFTDGRGDFIVVERFLDARHISAGPASARFTHDAFADAWRRIDGGLGLAYAPFLLGWFHTHPDLGAFLSEQDLFIHRHFFALAYQIALVVDPVRREFIFFRWRDGEVRSTGFFLVQPAGGALSKPFPGDEV